MGEDGATIKANYSKKTYTLTVTGGSGSNSGLLPGDGVEISAPAPASNEVFVGWKIISGSGSFYSSKERNTTFYIGSENTEIAPEYAEKKTVSLTVINGSGSVSGAEAHSVLPISADSIEGKVFVKWVLVEGSGNFYSSVSADTTFTMKEESATIEATYDDIPAVTELTDEPELTE